MGQMDDEKLNHAGNKRAKTKAGRSRRREGQERADLETCDMASLVALLVVAAKSGGAVRVGYTRDGGAYALGCYAGEDYATEYVKPQEDFADALREIVGAWFPDGLEMYDRLLEYWQQKQR